MVKSNFSINAEYYALRLCCGVVNSVPYELACGIAKGLAHLFFAMGFKRKRTLDRIRYVFPGISDAKAKAIAVGSLANFLQLAVEMIRAPKMTREWMDKYVVGGQAKKDYLQSIIDRGRGAVVMVPHCGDWLVPAWALAKYGLPIFAIGANHRNPKINDWYYHQCGDLEVLNRSSRDTLVKIKRYLQAGRAFAIMPDLRVPKRDVEAEFLGHTANVSHAGAMFALHAGTPIVLAAMTRTKGCKHVINYLGTLETEGHTAEELTKIALKTMSDFVMAHPESWFWYNKRWILEPVHD